MYNIMFPVLRKYFLLWRIFSPVSLNSNLQIHYSHPSNFNSQGMIWKNILKIIFAWLVDSFSHNLQINVKKYITIYKEILKNSAHYTNVYV